MLLRVALGTMIERSRRRVALPYVWIIFVVVAVWIATTISVAIGITTVTAGGASASVPAAVVGASKRALGGGAHSLQEGAMAPRCQWEWLAELRVESGGCVLSGMSRTPEWRTTTSCTSLRKMERRFWLRNE
jgi:hypothetical protein